MKSPFPSIRSCCFPRLGMVVAGLLCCGVWLRAESSAESPQKLIDAFYENLQKREIGVAVNDLAFSNPELFAQPESLEDTKRLLISIDEMAGSLKHRGVVTERLFGDCFFYQSSLLNYRGYMVWCEIMLYKPDDTWMLYDVHFSSKTSERIDRLIRAVDLQPRQD